MVRPLIVVLGPTAVGKTGFAIHLARTLNGEIVGADSRQIYRYMDIGTAKPTVAEREQAKHHLVDFVEPDATLSLAQYQSAAYTAIDDIHTRSRLPLLVGGTGQYISAIVEGWSIPTVPPNDVLRAQLEAEAVARGNEALHSRLRAHDPEAAEKIHPNNVRRVVRALEVFIETGTPITELQRKQPPPYRVLQLGLTLERERLYERADTRVDKMIEAGFVDEVRRLHAMGYGRTLPAMSGLGYAELGAYLAGETSLPEATAQTKINTHDFIRRQYTWFKGHDTGIVWHNTAETMPHQLEVFVAEWLET